LLCSSGASPKIRNVMRGAWRGLLLALLAIPANALFLAEIWTWNQSHPTTVSLFYNVVGPLFLLALLNEGVRRLSPRAALGPPDMLLLYAALCTSSAVSGLDWLQPLIALLPHAFWFAGPANRWAERICPYLPKFAVVSDLEALKGYYDVGSTFWTSRHMAAWLPSILFWSLLTFLLVSAMLCLSLILRRDWTERVRMAYPVLEVPRLLILRPHDLLRSRALRAGVAVAVVADLFNGLHYRYPVWPSFGGGRLLDIGPLFTQGPLSSIGWTPLALYPFAVGLAYFIPLELSFSCWFFYWVYKAQRIIASALGYQPFEAYFPYTREQGFGAFFVIALMSVWASRGAFSKAFGEALRLRLEGAEPKAAIGFLACFGGLLLMGRLLNLPWWASALAFSVYLVLAIAVSRIRAELGSPVHDLHFSGPDEMLPKFLGPSAFDRRALCGLTLLFGFNRAYRGHPMPHQLESFKLAQEGGIHPGVVTLAVVIGASYGILWGFLMLLHTSYRYYGPSGYGWQPFNRLDNWLSQPSGPNWHSILASLLGAGFTYALYLATFRFPWWPFHPVGYAVAGSWSINVFWLSIFMAWLCKFGILRYGGLSAHRRASPFFAGLIVGEFLMGTFWAILGNALHRGMYNFLP